MTIQLNPEVVLKAAQLAEPQYKWNIDSFDGSVRRYGSPNMIRFNPLTSDDDAMKLERALKRRDWDFGYKSTNYTAEYTGDGMPVFFADHIDPIVMLMVVAHLFSIPLYLEGGE